MCSWLVVGQVCFKGITDLQKKKQNNQTKPTVRQLKLFAKFITLLVSSFGD